METQPPNLVRLAHDIQAIAFSNSDGVIYFHDLISGKVLFEITGAAAPKHFLYCEQSAEDSDLLKIVLETYITKVGTIARNGTEVWIQETISIDFYRQLQAKGNHRHKIKISRAEDKGVVNEAKIVQRTDELSKNKTFPEFCPLKKHNAWALIPQSRDTNQQNLLPTRVYQRNEAHIESHGTEFICCW